MKIITKSDEETQSAGEEFAKKLNPTDVVFLIGDLGSGKTTFTKGLAKGLGIDNRIISPTFVVVRRHTVRNEELGIKNKGIKNLFHLDLYRLENEKQALEVDLKDYLEDKSGVTVIEWPEISQNLVKRKVWKVLFDTQHTGDRHLEIRYE